MEFATPGQAHPKKPNPELPPELKSVAIHIPLRHLKPSMIQVDYCKDVSDGFIKHNIIHVINHFSTIDDVNVLNDRI